MKSDEEVLKEFEEATAGLWLMSESDYPFEVFRWDGAVEITPRFLREVADQPQDAPVVVKTVDEFFGGTMSEAIWKADEGLGAAGRHKTLLETLKENLDDLRVYKVGEINIPVFIVGRSTSGNWVGLTTRVVET